MRLTTAMVFAGFVFGAAPALAQDDGHRIELRDVIRTAARPGAYQGRNNVPEPTERFSRKVKIGRGGRLDFEITESALMEDLRDSTRKLQRLFAAGLYIAIADFGTGYSSLGRWSKLPVHALKIYRSFI